MIYLEKFKLASGADETSFILSYPKQFEMQCYENNNAYPFKLFPDRGINTLEFQPITILYGGNGSGKSTILNVIAEKLGLIRTSPYAKSPCMPDYLSLCEEKIADRVKKIPPESRIITSDDVFDFLLGVRLANIEIDKAREELFLEYDRESDSLMKPLSSIDEIEDFKRRLDVRRQSKSKFVASRIPKDLSGKSNGESAYIYFTKKIGENALYLLDEPENSLSPKLEVELARFLSDSARFFGCQFIISTHSPILLGMEGAKVYDLDSTPMVERNWYELENVKIYKEFFDRNKDKFV